MQVDGTISNNYNIKTSITLYQNVIPEHKLLLIMSFLILLFTFVLSAYIKKEYTFFVTFCIAYTLFSYYVVVFGYIAQYETLYNFAYHALHTPFLKGLITPDAGYLPLIPRLFSFFLVRVLHIVDLYVISTFIFSITFASFCLSFFSLRYFRSIVKSDFARIFMTVLCLYIFSFLTFYDAILNVYNISYWGVGILFPILLIPCQSYSRGMFITLVILVPCIFLSKLFFLCYAPIFGVYTLYYGYLWLYKKDLHKREIILFSAGISGALGQLIYYFFISSEHSISVDTVLSITGFFQHFFARLLSCVLLPLGLGNLSNKTVFVLGLFMLIILYKKMISYMYNSIHKIFLQKVALITMIAYVIYIALVSLLCCVWVSDLHVLNTLTFVDPRHQVILIVLVYYCYAIFLYYFLSEKVFTQPKVHMLIQRKDIQNIKFILLFIFVMFLLALFGHRMLQQERTLAHFAWSKYAFLTKKEAYVIPNNSIYNSAVYDLLYNVSLISAEDNTVTNLSQVNAIYLYSKKISEILTLKAYDDESNQMFTLSEQIPGYNIYAYFLFEDRTNYISEIKIFNQNGVDRTKDFSIKIYTNKMMVE